MNSAETISAPRLMDWIQEARTRLEEAQLQCADPQLHSRQIASAALDLPLTQIYSRWTEKLGMDDLDRLESFISRRIEGEPFQYILGSEGFWNSDFLVGPGVLIPRPETEHLIETLLELEKRERVVLAELGAGSGCLGISTLLEKPSWEWHAFEISPDAYRYLEKNRAQILNDNPSYKIYLEDFFSGAAKIAPVDWIIANPPYLSQVEMKGLAKEVQHEPSLALMGGQDGMTFIDQLLSHAPHLLKPGGRLMVEFSEAQASAVRQRLTRLEKPFTIFKDFRDNERYFVVEGY